MQYPTTGINSDTEMVSVAESTSSPPTNITLYGFVLVCDAITQLGLTHICLRLSCRHDRRGIEERGKYDNRNQ